MPIALQAPSMPGQVASPLRGTVPRGLEDWQNALRSAPQLGAPVVRAEKRAADPAPTTPLLSPIANTVDAREPDRALGRNLTVTTALPEGGKVTSRFGNVDRGLAEGKPGDSPQVDVRVFDSGGSAQGALRIRRDTGAVSGSVRAVDGKTDVVVGGAANTRNPAANSLQVTLYRDKLGVRVQLDNPGGGRTATGGEGSRGSRVEVIGTGGGKLYPSGSSLQKGVEGYVFHAETGTPGSAAGVSETGAGVRLNDIQIGAKGSVPVTGGASLEVSNQASTNGAGQRREGLVVRADADLRIGKAGGVQGIVQPFVTYSAAGDVPVSGGVFGGVTIQLK